ncbi:MAG TPA: hypothetical protein VF665_14605 [Longimicrobium sp.]|uniref:hypothetical protein n=1 Tax=Longimicrobium sp. TaxID=2029185 RepID=UPI002EDA9C57
MMSRVVVTGARGRASGHAVVGVLQNYTGLTHPEASRLFGQVRAGERVVLDLDDEFAAYDLVSMLTDLGLQAEVADTH